MPPESQQPLVIPNKSCKRYFVVDGAKIYFTADFDSGNLQKVQQISPYVYKLHPGYDKTRSSTDKTFFHFKVGGFKMCTTRFIITRQHLLEKFIKNEEIQGAYKPVVKIDSGQWHPLKNEIKLYRNSSNQGELSFEFFFEEEYSWVQFAFTYPYSYEQNQQLLDELSHKFKNHPEIYFCDEILNYSVEGRKQHLITITERVNCSKEREEYPPGDTLFPEIQARPFIIDRPKIVISGRVHPGETPASHCIEGLIRFLLSQTDYRAYLLRKNFHFIIVPMLNPDGVYHGMFRVDTSGNNLNRFYQECIRKKQPTIWSFRKYLQTIENVLFYFDFHAHPSKKGFFIYGNAFEQFIHQVQAETFGKMVESNCPYFESLDSIFAEKQMTVREKNEQHSKQGCGRVFVHKLFGNIVHSYTVECGYFNPNKLNPYPEINHKDILSGDYTYDSNYEAVSMKQYTPDSYRLMGKSIMITILDIFHINPYPRVTLGQFKAISSIRKAVAMRVYHQAERFRMIDSNCYKKAKDIKNAAQEYYRERFGKWGLTISDNYGMKVKKRTFSINAHVYLLNGMKGIKYQKTQKDEVDPKDQGSLQKQLEKSIDSDCSFNYSQERSLAFESQRVISSKQPEDGLSRKGTMKFSASEKKIKFLGQQLPSSRIIEGDLLSVDQQFISKITQSKSLQKLKSRIDVSSKRKVVRNGEREKSKYSTIQKDKDSVKNKLQQGQERASSLVSHTGDNYSSSKNLRARRQSQQVFKMTRIGTFLQREGKKSEKKFVVGQRKARNGSNTPLPVLYKNYYDNGFKSKEVMKGQQFKQLYKLPDVQ